MQPNRSMPACTVIPVLSYDDVDEAVEWLCAAFGFTVRLRIGDHRAQLHVGDAAVVVTGGHGPVEGHVTERAHAVMVRVADVDAHYARALAFGARVSGPPADYPYGERQYAVEDLGGHQWTFSQTIADVAPEAWGAKPRATRRR